MTHDDWICPKCDNDTFEVAELRASGGGISSMFDIENEQFATVTCSRCQYTELYRTDSSSIQQVLDFLTT
jgi:predicted nucleic-acid-binding Zn-ribbon protein